MKRLLALFLLLLNCHQAIKAQCNDRYKEDIFPTLETLRDVVYGTNTDSKNNVVDLLMDIYQPQGDTLSLRPLMIFVHGGSFVGGSRQDQRIDLIAEYFARKGYVTANIEYRVQQTTFIDPILDFADANNWYQAIIRAVQDVNAAIRYFKKDAAENNNSFRIDTTSIILYGSSVGAITVLHQAFLKDTSLANNPFRTNIKKLGGLYGNSGNEGYSVDGVKAVIASSGAIQSENFFNENTKNIAYLAFHNNPDLVVPFDRGCFATAFCHLGYFYGGNRLSKQAKKLDMKYAFYPFNEVGHPVDEFANTDRRKFIQETTRDFLADILCSAIPTSVKNQASKPLNIYPNPSNGQINIQLPEDIEGKNFNVVISDISGRCVFQQSVQISYSLLINTDLPSGTYFVNMYSVESNENYWAKCTIVK